MTLTLIADIGGSNTRLAVTGPSGRPHQVHAIVNDSVNGIEDAIEQYLAGLERRPLAAVLAMAGPVRGRRATLTNRAWEIDLDRIEHRFGLHYASLLNDFEALAWALPLFGSEDVRSLGPDLPLPGGPLAAVGPGTGLGVAALVPEDEGWLAVASEAGHMSFGPAARDEWPVFEQVAKTVEAISAETLLSGPGLERLHRALHGAAAVKSARAIDEAASAGDDQAIATVALFLRLLGRFAGDITLAFKATGGTFIGGGVAQKLGALIDGAAFRAAFEAHPPYRHLLQSIPTFLVTCAEPGLLGCAAYATHLTRKARAAGGAPGRRVPAR